MKYHFLTIFIVAFASFFLQSCDKEVLLENPTKKIRNLFQIEDVVEEEGRILISSNTSVHSTDEMPSSISINGRFKGKSDQYLRLEHFKVNEYEVPFNDLPRKEHNLLFSNNQKEINFETVTNEMLGREVTISLDDKVFGSFQTVLYSPSPIKVRLPNGTKELNKNKDFKVEWDADQNHRYKNEEYVGLMLIYRASHSIAHNPNAGLPDENIVLFKHAADEEEEIIVSSEELVVFPEGGRVYTYLARGHQEIIEMPNDDETVVSLISYSSAPGMTITVE